MLEFVPFPLLIGLVILILVLVILWHRKYSLSYLFFFSVFCVYLLLVTGVTLFPMPIPDLTGGSEARQSAFYILSRVNPIPFDFGQFANLNPTYVFFREIVANIVLTMPFGFLISFLTPVKPRNIPMLALAVGLGIETIQLVMCLALGMAYRGVDINDALMNALGVLFGYGFFRLFSWLFLAMTKRLKLEHKGLFAYVHTISSPIQPLSSSRPSSLP